MKLEGPITSLTPADSGRMGVSMQQRSAIISSYCAACECRLLCATSGLVSDDRSEKASRSESSAIGRVPSSREVQAVSWQCRGLDWRSS